MGFCRKKKPVDDRHFKECLIIGPSSSGKSTLVKFIKDVLSTKKKKKNKKGSISVLPFVAPTIGMEIDTVLIPKSKPIRGFKLRELGGTFSSIWQKWFHRAHAFIFVVDGSDPSSFSTAAVELNKVISSQQNKVQPLLLIFNKRDETTFNNPYEENDLFNIDQFSTRIRVVETSMLSGKGLSAVIDWIASHTEPD